MVTALPSYAGLGLVVAVVMGPTGMAPADMADGAAASPAVRAVLWTAWIAALAPAARRYLLAPESAYLRWLPIPRPLFWIAGAAGLLVLELPWALLWQLASPPLGGVAAAVAAAGIHAAFAVRRRGRAWLLSSAAAAVAGVALLIRPSPDLVAIAAGLAALGIAAVCAFARAAEAPASIRQPRPRGGPVLALLLHHGGRLIDAALAGRIAVAAAVAGGLAGLFIRANELGDGAVIAAAVAAGAFGTAGVAVRVSIALTEDARASDWLVATAGTGPEARAVALVGAAAIGGGVAGAAVGAVVALFSAAFVAIAVSAVSAIAVAVVALAAGRAPVKARDARVWGLALAAASGLALAAAIIGPAALLIACAAIPAALGAIAT